MNPLFVLMLISLASADSANIEPSGLSCRQAQCQCEELSKRVEALEEILSPPKIVGQGEQSNETFSCRTRDREFRKKLLS